jgi:hypothetical protein
VRITHLSGMSISSYNSVLCKLTPRE